MNNPYSFEVNGKTLEPFRVSSILQKAGERPAITDSADPALIRGTEVHQYIASELTTCLAHHHTLADRHSGSVNSIRTEWPEDLEDFRNAYYRFALSHAEWRPVLIEQQLLERDLEVAGTADAFLRNDEGHLVLIDWKTATAEPSQEASRANRIQLAAYSSPRMQFCMADHSVVGSAPIVESAGIVYLFEDGQFRFDHLSAYEMMHYWREWEKVRAMGLMSLKWDGDE